MSFFKKIFSSKKRDQSNEDAALLAQQLLNPNDLMFADTLHSIQLDYDLNSLKELDYYLLKVRLYFQLKNQDAKSMMLKGQLMNELTPVILSVGAYLGETLRTHNTKLSWTENTQAMHEGRDSPSFAVLILTDHINTTSPMQEVINFICSQQQPDSLYVYAQKVLKN